MKILERIVLKKLSAAIIQKIRSEQFVFRPQHSITHQLVKLSDQLCLLSNIGEKTTAVFFDIEKAFDYVWHEGILHKMLQIGTPLNLCRIMKSFLSYRQFKISHNNNLSTSRPYIAGVTQVSYLSQILYNIFTKNRNRPCYLLSPYCKNN